MTPTVQLWTDGACSGNPGPGGWSAILVRSIALPAPDRPLAREDLRAHYAQEVQQLRDKGLLVDNRWPDRLDTTPLTVTVLLERSGGLAHTTNNVMEILGVLEGLRTLTRPASVAVHTDSKYVMDACTKWMAGWKRRGWKKADGQLVANRELLEQLDDELRRHTVTWVKVKGHSGVALNERCDALAVAACRQHGGSGKGR